MNHKRRWAAERLLKSPACLTYREKQSSNDWKIFSFGASCVVQEKEDEPIREIHFD
ncbi:hypothetical protein P4C99_11640 [Pontiellaceae bacterium B1224]|nr:hypothetical protein [Pontiellaceae bacterium B1224]